MTSCFLGRQGVYLLQSPRLWPTLFGPLSLVLSLPTQPPSVVGVASLDHAYICSVRPHITYHSALLMAEEGRLLHLLGLHVIMHLTWLVARRLYRRNMHAHALQRHLQRPGRCALYKSTLAACSGIP